MTTEYCYCDGCEKQHREFCDSNRSLADRAAPQPGEGCYRHRSDPMPDWQHVVSMAKQKYFAGSDPESVKEWLAGQYEALLRDASDRRRFAFKRPVARSSGDATALHGVDLSDRSALAENAAQGVVVAFSRCPEPPPMECHNCRSSACSGRE